MRRENEVTLTRLPGWLDDTWGKLFSSCRCRHKQREESGQLERLLRLCARAYATFRSSTQGGHSAPGYGP